MSERSSKRPRDPNKLAYRIVQEATGQVPKYDPREEQKPVDPTKNPAAVALGRLGGLKGGAARAAALSPKKRSAIAAKAAKARWSATKGTTRRETVKTQYPLQKPAKLPPPPKKNA